MGSIFTTIPGKTIKGFAGKSYPVPMYLQFVPGNVVEVVHSSESIRYGGPQTLNTIIALPHIKDGVAKKRSSAGEEFRYYPLLRTMHDIPSKGDPVLLCTIGRINYYLGPLNTPTNSPTWNDDPSLLPELMATFTQNNDTTVRGLKGESPNFNKEISYSRLSKIRKGDLDYGDAVKETTGDTLIEGRHGNSIRIGSRSNNPYIFLSNERLPTNTFENISDGTLISITSDGTLQEHFNGYYDVETEESINGFQLSSDGIEDNTYPIGDIHSDLNNGADIQETIYGYNGNQILFHSDRITINSKLDDIFISSIKDIHIGASRHMSINAPKSLNVLSDNVNIGNSNRATMESMVLGEALKEVLNDIINLIPSITITTQLGPQSPMPTIQADIQKITNKIESITSTKHKIEQG
tara:strand:- start:108 stop:1334 length:1227 start_codon:yes stop_codon:yes gene_type:complete